MAFFVAYGEISAPWVIPVYSMAISYRGIEFRKRRRWLPVVLAAAALLLVAAAITAIISRQDSDLELSVDPLQHLPFLLLPDPEPQPVELAVFGKKLFFDPRLSRDGTIACSTCHDPKKYFQDGKVTANEHLSRNTPSIVNSYAQHWFFWDGRADSMTAQFLGPMTSPVEHGLTHLEIVSKILSLYGDDYRALFGDPNFRPGTEASYGSPAPLKPGISVDIAAYALATIGRRELLSEIIRTAQQQHRAPSSQLLTLVLPAPAETTGTYLKLTADEQYQVSAILANVGRALAAYQSGIVANQSPFDRFAQRALLYKAVEPALDESFNDTALRGLQIFLGPGNCTNCHHGSTFSDHQFHNIGLPMLSTSNRIDLGRALGVVQVIQDNFNCLRLPVAANPETATTPTESCAELPYLTTESIEHIGAFKTPTLRNIAMTAPYFHDGRAKDLDAVLEHYNELRDVPEVGHREESLKPMHLSKADLRALKTFLESLTAPVRDSVQITVSQEKR